ncbi:MAG: SdiA-regulated domain-containing protein [Ferruginibacter sp.]
MVQRPAGLINWMIAFLFIFNACNNSGANTQGEQKEKPADKKETAVNYDYKKPFSKWQLPEQLNEISGIVKLDSSRVLAIEDLHPVLYVLNLTGEKAVIADTISFYQSAKEKVDIEDVTIIGNTVYALWSHGAIFKITDWQKTKQVKEIQTGLSKENNTEGITYDPATGNLLIACKNKSGIEDEKKSSRAIFEYDVKTDALKTDPFFVIETKEMKNITGEKVKFYPSAIAVHPITHDIYVISTRDTKCIARFSHDGHLKTFDYLDKELLPQPEGICFDPAGNLFISTEGKKGSPALIYEFTELKDK